MKENHRELPISVWKYLLEVMDIANKEDCIKKVACPNDSTLLMYVDTFSKDNFFYTIHSYDTDVKTGKMYYTVDKKPSDYTDLQNIYCNSLPNSFLRWLNFIKKYKEVAVTDDEDLLSSYQQEFFSEIDDHSDDQYLDTDAQIRVDNLLEIIEHKLLELMLGKNDSYLEEIINDVIVLRDTQTLYKKKELGKRVARILAKIKMSGIRVLKGFWDLEKKMIYKSIINGRVDGVSEYQDRFS